MNGFIAVLLSEMKKEFCITIHILKYLPTIHKAGRYRNNLYKPNWPLHITKCFL